MPPRSVPKVDIEERLRGIEQELRQKVVNEQMLRQMLDELTLENSSLQKRLAEREASDELSRSGEEELRRARRPEAGREDETDAETREAGDEGMPTLALLRQRLYVKRNFENSYETDSPRHVDSPRQRAYTEGKVGAKERPRDSRSGTPRGRPWT